MVDGMYFTCRRAVFVDDSLSLDYRTFFCAFTNCEINPFYFK